MNSEEILALARAGDIGALSRDTASVADTVRALVDAGDTASALELVGRAWRIWSASGKVDEGAAAAQVALDAPVRGDVGTWRARALYGDGVIAFRAGDSVRSRARNEELLEIARSSGDVRGECDGLTGLARLALRAGDYSEVVRLAREARERAKVAADVEAEAAPLHLEAAGVRLQRRYAAARALYLESLELNRRLGSDAWVAMEQHNLGWVALHLGDVDEADRWFAQRAASSGHDAYGDAWNELNQAGLAVARGDWPGARRHFDSGTRQLDGLGVVLDPDDAFERAWLEAEISERAK